MRMRGGIFWGIVLIILAALLLLRQLGIVNLNDIWGFFWAIVAMLFGVWMIIAALSRRRPVEGETVSIPLQGAGSARVKLDHGAGRMNLHSGAASGELLNGIFGGGLDHNAKVTDGRLEARLRSAPHFWAWGPGESLDWDINLSRDIPLSLDIDSGASASVLDLGDLKVTDLQIDTGASSTELTLPAKAGMTNVDIHTGASSVKMHIPSGVAARIKVKSGLASINVDSKRFPRQDGGIYQSPDYATATNRADINIETGVGSIDIS